MTFVVFDICQGFFFMFKLLNEENNLILSFLTFSSKN
jgi:hypothetical protein